MNKTTYCLGKNAIGKLLFTVMFIFACQIGFSQITEDFTDGNFTANPAWSGNTSDFSIMTASPYVSGGASTDGSYLASGTTNGNVTLSISSTEVNEWKFSLGTGSFSPSTSNYFGVILMSDVAVTGSIASTSWNGYYLKIGATSPDPIELWKKTGTTGTGTKVGNFSSSPDFDSVALLAGLNIRVTRNSSGVFQLYYSTGFTYASTPTTSAGTLTDNAITTSSYFGVYSVFANPSAARRVFIDNIVLGVPAAAPPVLTGGTVNGTVGTAITNYQIVATNSPTGYSIASGTLPTGLSLNTTSGVISGTPTVAGTSSITVNASNGAGTSASPATINFNIAKGNQTITFGTLANRAYGDASFTLGATASSGLTVTYVSSNTNVATVSGNMVTIVGVGTTNITASQAGNVNYNAATDVVHSLTVTQRQLTITGLTGVNRQYNATNVATVSGSATLNGVLAADTGNVTLSVEPTYTFANANIGTGKAITISGLSLTGSAAANYSLTLPSLSANITAKALTVTGAVAHDKVYNGTTVAAVTGATLNGVEAADVATVSLAANGTFASANVGTGITVTLSLTGAGIGNYTLTQPGLSANITIASQTITFNALPVLTLTSGSVNLNSYASSSSSLALTYSSSNPAVVSVSGNTMTVVGAGTATITASQAGNTNYSAATNATRNVVVLTAPVATAATAITSDGFTAHWNAVAGATSYEIDVYKVEGGMSNNPGSANWNFTTATPNTVTGDITVSALSQGNNNGTTTLLDNGSASSGYTNASGTNNAGAAARVGVLNTAASGSAYFQFTVTPDVGATITLTGISFGTRSTGTGPQAYALRSSLDNYGSDIATGTIASNSTWSLKSNTGLSLSGDQDEAITFRLFGYNGAGSPGANTANWRIDDLELTMTVLSSSLVNTYVLQNENVGNVTSYEVTDLDEATEYHYVVRAISGGVESGNSNVITVETTQAPSVVIWANGEWSNNNEGPTEAIEAIIEDVYVTATDGEFTAKSLIINTGGSLTVSSGTTVRVVEGLNNTLTATAVVIESNGALLQDGEVGLNSGNITVRRNSSAIMRQDYTLWSSPVIGQGLYAFSPTTLPNRFYTYNTLTDQYNAVSFSLTNLQYPSPLTAPNGINGTDQNNVQFTEATGYLIRTPWNHPTAPTVFQGEFKGVPNSGDITYEMALTGNGYNAVGNPYPSKLNVVKFIEDNPNITGTLYFWRKTNSSTATTYATLTSLAYNANQAAGGDTGAGYFNSGDEENWVINVGQGFLVQADTANNELYFTNEMRRGSSSANQFFRTSNVSATNGEIQGLYWLNLSNTTELISQTTVGYTTNSTLGIDYGIDGKNINKEMYLASLINGDDYAVQGRPSFEITDVVPMSYKVSTAGNYTINIDHTSGLFSGTQVIYLKDKLLQTVHNLTAGAYTFATQAGTFADRFEVVYRESALSVDNPNFTANQVVVYKNDNDQFVINTGNTIMDSVKVFDIRGRLLTSLDKVNASQTGLSVDMATQVLLIQIASIDGMTITKKVVR